MRAIRINLDSLGVFASALCIVHCLLLPFIVTGLALVGTLGEPIETTGLVDTPGPAQAESREVADCCEAADCCESADCCEVDACCDAGTDAKPYSEKGAAAPCCSTPTDFWIHVGLLGAVAPVGMIALGFGYRQHRQIGALAVGLTGVCLLSAALLFGHQLLNGRGEQWMTVSGSLCMVSAHLWNSRRSRCCARCQLADKL